MPFKNILIPTDFFEGFEVALEYAKKNCRMRQFHFAYFARR